MSTLAYCTAIELLSTADTQREPAVSGKGTVIFNLVNFASAFMNKLVAAVLHAA
jgi:hypothetical protein